MLPIQLNFAGSNSAALSPSNGSIDHRRGELAKYGAVVRFAGVEVIGGIHRAGARHVRRHDRRSARDEATIMPGENAHIGVVSTAGRKASDQRHRLMAVEVGDRIRVRRTDGGSHTQERTQSYSAKHSVELSEAQHVKPSISLLLHQQNRIGASTRAAKCWRHSPRSAGIVCAASWAVNRRCA